MKRILLSLMRVILSVATVHSAAADSTVPLESKMGEELHAAVTDMPEIIDMSHADPKSWYSLPPAAQVYDYDQGLAQEVKFQVTSGADPVRSEEEPL
jgi:hypothetical protein